MEVLQAFENRDKLLAEVTKSIGEERAAIDAYSRRAGDARNAGSSKIATMYEHIRLEEAQHVKELMYMADQLRKWPEPRKLQVFRGYTVDYRLREFRPIKFIPFDSPGGRKIVEEMKRDKVWRAIPFDSPGGRKIVEEMKRDKVWRANG